MDSIPLDTFITRLAQKMVTLYPSNCADAEDYIQAGHLKLAEIHHNQYKHRDFRAYVIIAIARAMRETALSAMGVTSAPRRIKRQIHRVELLLVIGKTEKEICADLDIDTITLSSLKVLINTESWHQLFIEPSNDPEPFSAIDDILSSCFLSEDDRIFIRAQLDDDIDSLGLTNKQQWVWRVKLRPKLTRSGYGTPK